MNAESLLAHYERVAEGPDSVARLRRFILELVLQGRLVVSEGAWTATTLGAIGEWGSGGTPLKTHPEYYNGDIPWLVIGDLNDGIVSSSETSITKAGLDNSSAKIVEPGTVLIAMYGSIGKLGIAGIRCATNQAIAFCVPRLKVISVEFLFLLLRGIRHDLLARGQGVAQQNISQKILKAYPITLPPLAEQHRIVAKVDELMVLCDRLETARAQREATRDRLTASTLARLNTPEPPASPDGDASKESSFQSDARFALKVLPALTTRSDQTKRLRQTILSLALRGKLTLQDRQDQPASAFLREIAKAIADYVKTNRIRPTDVAAIAEVPFVLPRGWQWTRLCNLFAVVTDGDHQPPPRADRGVAFLTIGNVTTGQLDFSGCRLVAEEYFESLPKYRVPERGDILYTVVGATFGRPCPVDSDRPFCVQRHIAILKPAAGTNRAFLLKLLSSPLVYSQASSGTTGTAQPTVALGPLRNFLVPVPPLAEQHRIVAKFDELMYLCDQLEAALTRGESTRSRLLNALLHEALAPQELAA